MSKLAHVLKHDRRNNGAIGTIIEFAAQDLQSLRKSPSDASKPSLSIRSAQPIEPHSSHLLEARIIRVQRIVKIRCRVESGEHVNDADFLASFGTSIDNTLHLRVERLDVRVRVRARGRDDLRHHDRSLRPLGHDVVDQLAEARVCVFPAVGVAVVGAGVQQDDVGRNAGVGNAVDRAGDLVDDPARVAFVVFVGHGAALHGADVVDFGAGGGQRGEQELAVAIAGGTADAILLFGWS